jgi:hypothetical protein
MEWKRQNPEKVSAHLQVASALKRGILKNPGKCAVCGENTTYLDAHHEDYTKPLAVVWVCPKCHRGIHKNKKIGLKAEGE